MARIVLITHDGIHGQRVLQTVRDRGIVLDAVLYLTGSFGIPAQRGAGLGQRLLRWPRRIAGAARAKARFHGARKAKYQARCATVIDAGAINGPRLLRALASLAPDWILLGGGGIVSPEVIAAARCGVLNAHPALLPWIRGVGTVGASLQPGVALGATLHYVDAGIDTGALVQRRLVPVGPDDRRLGLLERACWELAAGMMADAVEGIVRRGEVPAGVAQDVRFPLFRRPDAAELERRRALAAAGRARELYEAWAPLCIDQERRILPAGPVHPPSVTTLEPVGRLPDPGRAPAV